MSTLTVRLPGCGAGDVTRCCGSTLDARFCILVGMAGTGGASGGRLGDIVPFPRSRDELLNVRSVMEPLLFLRSILPRPIPPLITMPLPTDDCDPRRIMRFVCKFPTGSGDEVWDRSAAAAAAEDSEGLEALLRLRKAAVAAALAF